MKKTCIQATKQNIYTRDPFEYHAKCLYVMDLFVCECYAVFFQFRYKVLY